VFTQKKAIIPLDIFKIPEKDKNISGNEYAIRIRGNETGGLSMTQANLDLPNNRLSYELGGITVDRAGSNIDSKTMPGRSSSSIAKNMVLDLDEIQEITKISINLEAQIN
jgi:hypothetical protein